MEVALNNCSNNHLKQQGGTILDFFCFFLCYLKCANPLITETSDTLVWLTNTFCYEPLQFFSETVVQTCSVKKGILRNFAKLSGKRLCQSLYFNKVAGLRPANLLKQRLWRRCFLENFAKFLRTPFLIEHLWWLLLSYGHSSIRCILTRNNFITLIVLLWSPLALR